VSGGLSAGRNLVQALVPTRGPQDLPEDWKYIFGHGAIAKTVNPKILVSGNGCSKSRKCGIPALRFLAMKYVRHSIEI